MPRKGNSCWMRSWLHGLVFAVVALVGEEGTTAAAMRTLTSTTTVARGLRSALVAAGAAPAAPATAGRRTAASLHMSTSAAAGKPHTDTGACRARRDCVADKAATLPPFFFCFPSSRTVARGQGVSRRAAGTGGRAAGGGQGAAAGGH
jgi:hypothetical protein